MVDTARRGRSGDRAGRVISSGRGASAIRCRRRRKVLVRPPETAQTRSRLEGPGVASSGRSELVLTSPEDRAGSRSGERRCSAFESPRLAEFLLGSSPSEQTRSRLSHRKTAGTEVWLGRVTSSGESEREVESHDAPALKPWRVRGSSPQSQVRTTVKSQGERRRGGRKIIGAEASGARYLPRSDEVTVTRPGVAFPFNRSTGPAGSPAKESEQTRAWNRSVGVSGVINDGHDHRQLIAVEAPRRPRDTVSSRAPPTNTDGEWFVAALSG